MNRCKKFRKKNNHKSYVKNEYALSQRDKNRAKRLRKKYQSYSLIEADDD